VILEGFSRQQWEKENKIKSPESYIWFSLCSQTCKRMIKDFYFLSGLSTYLAKCRLMWPRGRRMRVSMKINNSIYESYLQNLRLRT
jgi:hypothetical protein